MSTAPNTPPIVQPASSPDQTLLAALKYARETARDEIESVERLHKRTLLALTVPLSAFGILFSIVGWIGYTNLKRVAVSTSTEIVKQRLDDQLTRLNIDDSVQGVLRDHAGSQIKDAVADQISKQTPQLQSVMKEMTAKAVNELRPQIEISAKTQAQEYIRETFKPRTIDGPSAASLISCLKVSSKIRLNIAVGGDPEAQSYERELADALQQGGWQTSEQALLGFHANLPRYGLALVTSQELGTRAGVKNLQKCFRQAGVMAPLFVEANKDSELSGLTSLVVLPKPR
jgi:hypothetical protein